MLDIGWNEILVIAVITVIVVGPKELPRVLRTVTQVTRKIRAMASEFQSGIDEIAREADLDELKRSIEETGSTDIAGELEKSIDPTGEITESVRELEESLEKDMREAEALSGTEGPELLAPTLEPKAEPEEPVKPAPAKRKSPKKKTAGASTRKRKAGDGA